jgi:hypothetical protein
MVKVQQIKSLGYYVATLPREVRDAYRSKAALGELGVSIKRLFRREGYKRGLRRWHFFGDKSLDFHPHLNILVDGGLVPPEKLERLRRGLARILGVSVDRINLHYQFYTKPAQIVHKVKYVTRATFLDWRWDEDLARELVGFRNTRTWGKWDDESAWSLADLESSGDAESCEEVRRIESLEKGVCPHCQTKITWGGDPVRMGPIRSGVGWDPIGGGYYQAREYAPVCRDLTEDELAAWAWVVENVVARRYAGTVDQN